jgi:hypothetical protein
MFQMTCMFGKAGKVQSHQAWLGSFGSLTTDDACMKLYASSSSQLELPLRDRTRLINPQKDPYYAYTKHSTDEVEFFIDGIDDSICKMSPSWT